MILHNILTNSKHMNFEQFTLEKNDCGKHFPKCLFIEDVISQWLKVYKRKW